MTDSAICPALGPGGRRCERWNQPAAHVIDDSHQAGDVKWPAPAQLLLDLAPDDDAEREARR